MVSRISTPSRTMPGSGYSGDDDDTTAHEPYSKLRSRLNPWRPPPLTIPCEEENEDTDKGAQGCGENIYETSVGSRDSLREVEKEIAEIAAERAQLLQELEQANHELTRMRLDAVYDTKHDKSRHAALL